MSKRIPQALQTKVEEFAAKMLPGPTVPRGDKVIHDAIWGTQLLRKHEVSLLDTPLLQRLRGIRQTGFSFLTYPSTTHTRFEHSLGVLYQANKLAGALHTKYFKDSPEKISPDYLLQLRMAALLHDCSHGPFSHTSEEVYRFFPDMQQCIEPGGHFEQMSPSEVLACLTLQTEAFKTFFKKLSSQADLNFKPDNLAEMILGRKKDLMNAYKIDILNGPFDADKLDYIFRDSHYSGLPVSVDTERLWLATEIQVIPKGKFPNVEEDMQRVVVNKSGVTALEQIVAARMVMTSGLYHHHKVRACDCMFKAILERTKQIDGKICGREFTSAADFLFITDSDILSEAERSKDKVLRRIVGNILQRRLLKRAFLISADTIVAPARERKNLIYRLINLRSTAAGQSKLRKLAQRICQKAGHPCDHTEVWIDLPDAPKMHDLQGTFVNIASRRDPDFARLSDFMPVKDWGVLYLEKKWQGHVFCPAPCKEAVGRAAIPVLEEEFETEFGKTALL